MTAELISPVTGLGATNRLEEWNGILQCMHSMPSVGDLFMGEELATSWQWGTAPRGRDLHVLATPDQLRRVQSLARSYAWRNSKGLAAPLWLCLDSAERSRIIELARDKGWLRHYNLRAFGEFVHEADRLTFQDRMFETLRNFEALEKGSGQSVAIQYLLIDKGNTPVFRTNGSMQEDGMSYATDATEAHLVYQGLYEGGYIRWPRTSQEAGFALASKGAAKLDELRHLSASGAASGVFVIQPFNEELNAFLRPVLGQLEERLGVKVRAVWDEEHIERIDERIFRQIAQSAAVLLYVANDRFNVGLECGYALALGKPVVAFREKPSEAAPEWSKRLPFDIATLNCYDYDPGATEELIEKLHARLALALPLVG